MAVGSRADASTQFIQKVRLLQEAIVAQGLDRALAHGSASAVSEPLPERTTLLYCLRSGITDFQCLWAVEADETGRHGDKLAPGLLFRSAGDVMPLWDRQLLGLFTPPLVE